MKLVKLISIGIGTSALSMYSLNVSAEPSFQETVYWIQENIQEKENDYEALNVKSMEDFRVFDTKKGDLNYIAPPYRV